MVIYRSTLVPEALSIRKIPIKALSIRGDIIFVYPYFAFGEALNKWKDAFINGEMLLLG